MNGQKKWRVVTVDRLEELEDVLNLTSGEGWCLWDVIENADSRTMVMFTTIWYREDESSAPVHTGIIGSGSEEVEFPSSIPSQPII